MSDELAKMHVSVGADIKDFKTGIEKLSGKMKDVGKKMTDMGKGLTKNVTAPIMGIAAAATGLAMKFASMGDDIAKTSTKLGVSTDALQEMNYWASQNGISAGSLERAVGRLNQRIGRAAEGNEKYAEAFKAIDVSLHDTEGNLRSTEDVMQDTIAALREIEDPALQSAAASEIFGTKMARDLMPALQDTSMSLEEAAQKIHELGGVMSEDAVRASEAFQDNLDNLKREFQGLWMEVAEKLIPLFNDTLMPMFRDTLIPLVSRITEALTGLVEWFSNLSPQMQQVIIVGMALAAALGPVLIIVGQIVGAIGTILPLLKVAAVAIAGVATPIGIVVAALGILFVAWKAFPAIVEVVKIVAAGIAETFGNIRDTVLSLTDSVIGAVQSKWESFAGFFKGIWDGIGGTFKAAGNVIIGLVNKMIDGINKLSITIPDWVPGGGGTIGFNVSKIPALASGGIIRDPGSVLVGEQGPEILHLPRGAAVEPLGAGAGGFNIHIQNAYMNSQQDIESLARKLDDRMRARGRRA